MADDQARLRGEVLGVRYESPEGNFRVVNVRTEKGRNEIVCGEIPPLFPGQWCEFTGTYRQHRDFGRQFHAKETVVSMPGTLSGLKKFLTSCVNGIGPKNAERIVDYFKEKTLDVLDNEPGRLRNVPGIGPKRAEALAQIWRLNNERRDGMIFMQSIGLSVSACNKLYNVLGEEAPARIRENPYMLCTRIDGYGFVRADQVASKLGIEPDNPHRMVSAIVYQLENAAGDGHVGLPMDDLLGRVAEITGNTPASIRAFVDDGLEKQWLSTEFGLVYLPKYHYLESNLPKVIARLASARVFAGARMDGSPAGSRLAMAPEQADAVAAVTRTPLSIVTGGPGVGKTTVVGEIVRRARAARLLTRLAAPTGRAAKRLTESTGVEAMTIHRLLQYSPENGRFVHDAHNPLDCQLLVVDEVSMLDISLAHSLFSAVRPGTSVVLVGDVDQLPSVGPGRILQDLIGSGFFGVTRLTRVFRQASGSSIVLNAHLVNAGKMPEPAAAGAELGDYYFIEQDDPAAAARTVGRLVAERIPHRFGYDPTTQVQVLTPMNRGECGTIALNQYLGGLLNGDAAVPGFRHGESTFRRGDKVMQRRNNYDKNVFNGDIGTIGEIYNSLRKFVVCYDDREVEYSFDEAGEIVHAYAITVHKSQGCEFPAVVLVLLNAHYLMLQRKLVYTAMTRAKRLLVVVGTRRAMQMAVHNVVVESRRSALGERFRLLRKTVPGA